MDPRVRTLLRVETLEDQDEATKTVVDDLMGTKAETRFRFIQENAAFAKDLDI